MNASARPSEGRPERGRKRRRRAQRGAAERSQSGTGGDGGPIVLLQRVTAAERAIHLDMETDDVPAEVGRLEKLGARVKARIRNHVVMEAPSGHPFCVVPVYRPDFPARAVEWP